MIADETIMLDPLTIAYDPDGDSLSFSFSGWKEEYWSYGSAYITTEADIGVHEVYVTISDPESLITEALVITVYPGNE